MTWRINVNVADIRRESSNKSERISQGLFNEIVEIVEDVEGMQRIRFTNGYEGWILRQLVSEHDRFDNDELYIVDTGLAPAFENPALTSRRITFLPYGCSLYGTLAEGFLKIRSERYGVLYISMYNLIGADEIAPLSEIDDLQREAEKFLGAPYLWGGRTLFGIDCSGFVGAITAHYGIELPRDTIDQIKCGVKLKRDEIRRGDLLFFPRHVALALSKEFYIHSSRSNGGVAFNSLNPHSPIYNEILDRSFVVARRVL